MFINDNTRGDVVFEYGNNKHSFKTDLETEKKYSRHLYYVTVILFMYFNNNNKFKYTKIIYSNTFSKMFNLQIKMHIFLIYLTSFTSFKIIVIQKTVVV